MQKILIGKNITFYTCFECIVDLLMEAYGEDREFWESYPCDDDMIMFRIDPNFHNIVSQKPQDSHGDFIIGKEWGEDILLRIICIPDDVKWHICQEECSTGEYICENHRVWT